MLVCGLMIVLKASTPAQTLEALREHPGLDLRLPAPGATALAAVLEAEDDASCRQTHGWIEKLPGVEHVEVVYIAFS